MVTSEQRFHLRKITTFVPHCDEVAPHLAYKSDKNICPILYIVATILNTVNALLVAALE